MSWDESEHNAARPRATEEKEVLDRIGLLQEEFGFGASLTFQMLTPRAHWLNPEKRF